MNSFESLIGKLVYAGFLTFIFWKPVSFLGSEIMSWHDQHYVARSAQKMNYLGMPDDSYSTLMAPPRIDLLTSEEMNQKLKELTEVKSGEAGIFGKPEVKNLFPDSFRGNNSSESSSIESH